MVSIIIPPYGISATGEIWLVLLLESEPANQPHDFFFDDHHFILTAAEFRHVEEPVHNVVITDQVTRSTTSPLMPMTLAVMVMLSRFSFTIRL